MKKRMQIFLMGMTLCLLAGCGKTGEVPQDSLAEDSLVEESQLEESQLESVQEPEYFDCYSSLADLAQNYGFALGAVMGESQMKDEAYQELVATHFNSLTASNELKAYSLLDQKASQADQDGMPAMNYTKGDAIVAYAQENGMVVRGHTLVWDAYMTTWFFREGYTWNGDFVDQETMKARLQSYITDVITHFETNFPGVVVCWDVVNEAVADSVTDCEPLDPKRVRKLRNGEVNPFYEYVGADYVELSFLYAKDAVEQLQAEDPSVNILLFYNDYNTFMTEKRTAICNLVESINSYVAGSEEGTFRKLCDGVGMQSYIGGYGQQSGCMSDGDLERVQKAILAYSALDVEVHATELAVRNYRDDAETMEKHADFYRKLFQMYTTVNEKGGNLTSVSIWGLIDHPTLSQDDYSYKMNGPFCGLFTEEYDVKDSFRQVHGLLSGE